MLTKLESGKIKLSVAADGDWEIEITQPNWSTGSKLPQEYAGKGDAVVGPFVLEEGQVTITYSYGGTGDSIVFLACAGSAIAGGGCGVYQPGDKLDTIFSEQGNVELKKTLDVKKTRSLAPGIYVLGIQVIVFFDLSTLRYDPPGNWAVTIESSPP